MIVVALLAGNLLFACADGQSGNSGTELVLPNGERDEAAFVEAITIDFDEQLGYRFTESEIESYRSIWLGLGDVACLAFGRSDVESAMRNVVDQPNTKMGKITAFFTAGNAIYLCPAYSEEMEDFAGSSAAADIIGGISSMQE